MAPDQPKDESGSTTAMTSPAVEETMRQFPNTRAPGLQLDAAEQDPDKTTRSAAEEPATVAVEAFASNTVQGPASIVELARALNVDNNGPQLMYEFVANNIEWEADWGSKKGALGCLLDGMGTQFDQSILLANLLRQEGFTANIVQGTIRLTEAQFQAWWNVTDIWAAYNYCRNQFIPIVTEPFVIGSTNYMEIKHVWVAWVNGATTYYFDPSFKQYSRKSPMSGLATALGYNQTTFMNNAQSGATIDGSGNYVQNMNRANIRADLQTLTTNLVNYIKNNAVGSAPAGTATVDDVLGGQTIVPVTLPVLQTVLPYQKPGDTPIVWTGDVPSSLKSTLQVQFPNWNTPGVWDFTYQIASEQLAATRLTIWYTGTRIPKLYLNGSVVATGLQQPSGTWTSIYLTVAHPAYAASNYPLAIQQNYVSNYAWWQSQIYERKYYLIANAWGNLGRGQLNYHQTQMTANVAAGGGTTDEDVLGERLAMAWYNWAAQNSKVADLINRLKNCHTMYSHQVGVLSFDSAASNSIGIDLQGVRGSTTNLANDTTQTPPNDTILAMHGVSLEAAICAQAVGLTPGIATPTVIDKATTNGNKIYKGTSANWNTGVNVRNILVANGYNSTDMDNLYSWYIQYGDSVLIADHTNQILGTWTGWGYWDLISGAGARGVINGGGKGGKGQQGDPDKILDFWETDREGQDESNEPVGYFTGDYFYDREDITVGSGQYPYKLSFGRKYSSANQYVVGPLGRGWTHNFAISAKVGSNGFLSMGDQTATQGAASIAELYVALDLISDTARPVSKLVTVTLAEAWWIDQIVNNTVNVQFAEGSQIFVKMPDGSYAPPVNNANKLTLVSGLYTLTSPQQVKWNFNSAGTVATIVYPYGVTLTFGYHASGRLTSVTNGLGRTFTLVYNGAGTELIRVEDGNGRDVRYTINGAGNLTRFKDARSKNTDYEYDQPGRLTKYFKPENPTIAMITNVYDSLSRVKTQANARNQVWEYYLAGARTQEKDPVGNKYTLYFNRFGSTIREINALGFETKSVFDNLNRRTETTFPEGNKIQWSYDLNNNVLTKTMVPKSGSGLSNIVNIFTYHATFNKVTTLLDGRSNTWTWNYDAANGNLLSAVKPMVGGQTPQEIWTSNSRGQVLTYTDETSVVTKFSYDTSTEKLLTKVVDFGTSPHLNLTTTLGYNAVGDVTGVTNANSNQTTFLFDEERRMIKKTDPTPLSYITNFGYDDNNNPTSIARQKTTTGYLTTVISYTVTEQKYQITDPMGRVSTFEYDGKDRLQKFTDAQSRLWQYGYDALDRRNSVTDPTSTVSETRTFTNNGQLYQLNDARIKTTTYSRDGHDRLDRTTYADSTFEQNQSYDGNSNVLTYRTRSGSTIVNTFDALNRLATKAPSGQATVTITYDLAGRLTKSNTPVVSGNPATGDFQFFFDTAGRYFKETTPDLKDITYVLDGIGNITKLTYPDGYYVTRVFDQINRLTDVKLNGAASTALHFDFDKLSRRTTLTYANGAVVNLGYQDNDDMNSLAQVFSGSASATFTYGFNNVHEEISRSITDGNFMWHPSAGGTSTYGIATDVNEYPTVGGVSQSYNGNGCLTGDGIWTFGYDTENHLLTATKTGVSASYNYDGSHRQIQKTVGSAKTRFIYAGWQRIADYDGTTGLLQTRYVYGAGLDEPLIAVDGAGAPTYLHADRMGSVIATTNSSGVVTNKNKIAPFGESTISGTSFGFTGQRYDAESGLYYFKRRYYSPAIGRFLQTDIVYSDGLNLYQYAQNNPAKFTDPLGLESGWGNKQWGGSDQWGSGYQWGGGDEFGSTYFWGGDQQGGDYQWGSDSRFQWGTPESAAWSQFLEALRAADPEFSFYQLQETRRQRDDAVLKQWSGAKEAGAIQRSKTGPVPGAIKTNLNNSGNVTSTTVNTPPAAPPSPWSGPAPPPTGAPGSFVNGQVNMYSGGGVGGSL